MGYEERHYSYSVKPYSAEWAEIYMREAARITGTLRSELIFIEHAGGTAVPGHAGRSTVDIVAVVRRMGDIDAYDAAFRAIGYRALSTDDIIGARRFRKDAVCPKGGWECLADLFIFPEEHPRMMAMLGLRNYLLAHPDEARRYAEFKMKLFEKYPRDHTAYEEAKQKYLEQLVKKAAREEGQDVDERGSLV